MTESAAFKRWFGKSKIVNEDGAPLVVYHGTDADFDAFDPQMIGTATDAGHLGRGFYFASDPRVIGKRSVGLAVYLRAENPLVLHMPDFRTDKRSLVPRDLSNFDAVIVDYSPTGYNHREIMVMSPAQIKSAIGNSGAYDPASLSLTDTGHFLAEPDTPRDILMGTRFKKWFSGSHVVDGDGRALRVFHGTCGPEFEHFQLGDSFGAGMFGRGIHFSSSAADASKYASSDVGMNLDLVSKAEVLARKLAGESAGERFSAAYRRMRDSLTAGRGRVIPAYLALKNPLVVSREKMAIPERVFMLAAAESDVDTEKARRLFGWFNQAQDGLRQFERLSNNAATKIYRQAATLLGHDGLIVMPELAPKGNGATHYIAFGPEQIMSSVCGAVMDGTARPQSSFERWCGGGVVRDAAGEPMILYHGTRSPEQLTHFVGGGVEGSIQSGDAYGVGAYLTSSAQEASFYARETGAVLPVYARGELLDIDAPLSAEQAVRVTKLANEIMLPSDKARFDMGRAVRSFEVKEEARDFFENQCRNWEVFGDGMDRAKPEVIPAQTGFSVEYTNFDGPVSIETGREAFTLFSAVGWQNLAAAGFDGLVMQRDGGKKWVVLHRHDGNVKSAVGNSGNFNEFSRSLTDHAPRYRVISVDDMTTQAFVDVGFGYELARLAREALKVQLGEHKHVLRDLNGNTVGCVELMDTAHLEAQPGSLRLVVESGGISPELIDSVCCQIERGLSAFRVLGPNGEMLGGVVSGSWPDLVADALHDVENVMEM